MSTGTPDQVSIATAFFSPTGFAHIADQLALVPKVRLLLGADLSTVAFEDRKRLDETEKRFERRRIESGLRSMNGRLERERDHLPFTRTNSAALAKLIAALRAGNMEVRRYEETFLHAKAYIFTTVDGTDDKAEGIIAGSSNLTGAGLTRNLELNLGRFDRPIVEQARRWFDDLWEKGKPYDLAQLFEVVFEPRMPWDIFVRVLWQLYGSEVENDAQIDENLPLTSFQKHGVARALRLIRDTGGVIVADEVGLGKESWPISKDDDGNIEVQFEPVYRPEIVKQSKEVVSTTGFWTDDYKAVSAVLYSDSHVGHACVETGPLGSDFILLQNPSAAVPIPKGLISQAKNEYWVGEGDRCLCCLKEN